MDTRIGPSSRQSLSFSASQSSLSRNSSLDSVQLGGPIPKVYIRPRNVPLINFTILQPTQKLEKWKHDGPTEASAVIFEEVGGDSKQDCVWHESGASSVSPGSSSQLAIQPQNDPGLKVPPLEFFITGKSPAFSGNQEVDVVTYGDAGCMDVSTMGKGKSTGAESFRVSSRTDEGSFSPCLEPWDDHASLSVVVSHEPERTSLTTTPSSLNMGSPMTNKEITSEVESYSSTKSEKVEQVYPQICRPFNASSPILPGQCIGHVSSNMGAIYDGERSSLQKRTAQTGLVNDQSFNLLQPCQLEHRISRNLPTVAGQTSKSVSPISSSHSIGTFPINMETVAEADNGSPHKCVRPAQASSVDTQASSVVWSSPPVASPIASGTSHTASPALSAPWMAQIPAAAAMSVEMARIKPHCSLFKAGVSVGACSAVVQPLHVNAVSKTKDKNSVRGSQACLAAAQPALKGSATSSSAQEVAHVANLPNPVISNVSSGARVIVPNSVSVLATGHECTDSERVPCQGVQELLDKLHDDVRVLQGDTVSLTRKNYHLHEKVIPTQEIQSKLASLHGDLRALHARTESLASENAQLHEAHKSTMKNRISRSSVDVTAPVTQLQLQPLPNEVITCGRRSTGFSAFATSGTPPPHAFPKAQWHRAFNMGSVDMLGAVPPSLHVTHSPSNPICSDAQVAPIEDANNGLGPAVGRSISSPPGHGCGVGANTANLTKSLQVRTMSSMVPPESGFNSFKAKQFNSNGRPAVRSAQPSQSSQLFSEACFDQQVESLDKMLKSLYQGFQHLKRR